MGNHFKVISDLEVFSSKRAYLLNPRHPPASSQIDHVTIGKTAHHAYMELVKVENQPMSKLAESHSEMEFYFIHFGPIRSCGGSHLDPVIKDTAGFHSK